MRVVQCKSPKRCFASQTGVTYAHNKRNSPGKQEASDTRTTDKSFCMLVNVIEQMLPLHLTPFCVEFAIKLLPKLCINAGLWKIRLLSICTFKKSVGNHVAKKPASFIAPSNNSCRKYHLEMRFSCSPHSERSRSIDLDLERCRFHP